jgi:hypothetical protein
VGLRLRLRVRWLAATYRRALRRLRARVLRRRPTRPRHGHRAHGRPTIVRRHRRRPHRILRAHRHRWVLMVYSESPTTDPWWQCAPTGDPAAPDAAY